MRQLWVFLCFFISASSWGQETWPETLAKAKGQTVYFYAWGGSQSINDYIRWAARAAQSQYGIEVKHVKVADTANVVNQVLAEKTAGKHAQGSVDLVWINGENFASMKANELLHGPFAESLPNFVLVDIEQKPSIAFDFGTPVEGYESPWGMAQFVFMADSAKVKPFPASALELLAYLKQNPGQFSYPKLPDFHGVSFLKQMLIETSNAHPALYQDIEQSESPEQVLAPLWHYLDQLHPLMWRQGKTFVSSQAQLKAKLNDEAITIAFSFNPNDAANSIATGELPETVKTYVHKAGSLGNTHFVAIPYNANAKAGAKVFANFLLSPEAQARKADPAIWGDPTVLALNKLTPQQTTSFNAIERHPASLTPVQLGHILVELHPSWVGYIEKEWIKRYGQ
ncbi:ABC transporter substrate-binding protein [Motilimonas pumila]|uniref:ABC transporter substrate-binding protein n=1 Tax=Motilimonas pumila TaxID=2303987 RepID=A0A418YCE2_9GAMM|nr:ABC transporter substrate-binding protein [Motilimonas pumila]RJG42184.1 ABC transporter substrate-binding protein [Motilimonas pumila]